MTPRLLLHCLFLPLVSAGLLASEVRIRVVGDDGAPIPDARAVMAFMVPLPERNRIFEGLTDGQGGFARSAEAIGTVLVRLSKEGYYESVLDRLPSGENLQRTVILRRVIKPVPLYVQQPLRGSLALRFPAAGEWCGYDFTAGDWVRPHGRGQSTDIRFRYRMTFTGWAISERELAAHRAYYAGIGGISEERLRRAYGRQVGELEVGFSRPQEGLVEVTDRFLPYTPLRMPHQAPEAGYVSSWRYPIDSANPAWRDDVGFFLRTRVRLDGNGRILSANYAKVHGDFQLTLSGELLFGQFFNPVPNDRNLEWDPARNLFPDDALRTNVHTR